MIHRCGASLIKWQTADLILFVMAHVAGFVTVYCYTSIRSETW